MQTKRYETAENFTLGSGTQLSEVITNADNLRVNWHGIRFQGRIFADIVSADNNCRGFLGIMCLPPGLSTPTIANESDLNDNYQYIIAVTPWYV